MTEIDNKKLIARGGTAEIYNWNDGWVLKLFYPRVDEETANYEARLARAVHAAGMPVPAVGELLQVDGRHGIVYERVDGPTMFEALRSKPLTMFRSARQLAALHVRMHSGGTNAGLPPQRERLERKINNAQGLDRGLKEVALRELKSLPDGNQVCHGDFHPGNVILTKSGPSIIDWIDANQGNPLADTARTTVLLLGVVGSEVANPFEKLIIRLYHRAYIREYFRLNPGGEDEYRAWIPIIAAARLSEGIREFQDWLLAQAKAGLEKA